MIEFKNAPGTNGEKAFHNVMRKMYPNPSGTPVDAGLFASAGGVQEVVFTDIAIPSYIYKKTEIAFVAWVQNTQTKEVYQAGYSKPLPVPNEAMISGVSPIAALACTTDLSDVTVSIKNLGSNAITDATINYKIDNAAVATVPFSGSIDIDGTSDVIIPATTLASGSHKITIWMTGINGSTSTKKFNESTQSFALISAEGTIGDLEQDFSASGFPYANYSVYSETGKNWTRVTTNTGSMKFAAYDIEPGNVGEVYLAPVNTTSIGTKVGISFDVAHARYSAQYTEKLDVMVSKDCGDTWTTVYSKSGADLATAPSKTSTYTPVAADWRRDSLSLESFGTAEKVFIKFVATSDFGNNIYIDNINVMPIAGANTAGINEETQSLMTVFPNPTEGDTQVSFTGNNGTYTITVTDISGRTLTSTSVEGVNGVQTVDLATSDLSSGNYLVSISGNGQVETQQLVIK